MRRCLALTLLAFGLAAGPAHALERFASPSGSGVACTAGSPCSLRGAMTQALAASQQAPAETDDVVTLAPGSYAPDGSPLPLIDGYAVRGAAIGAGARPVVQLADQLSVTGTGVVRDVELRKAAAGGSAAISAIGIPAGGGAPAERPLIDRVVVRSADDGCAVDALAQLRESLCTSTGPTSSGIRASGDAVVRNTTAVATGGDGVTLEAGSTASILGVIASGPQHGITGPGAGAATIRCVSTSPEVRAIAFPATFTDYRAPAGSATIDACVPADFDPFYAPGELDLDGNLRLIDPKIDVGAYEAVKRKPDVTGADATGVSQTAATMNASLATNGGFTTFSFDWGVDTKYGATTGSGFRTGATATAALAAPLTGLRPGTTYHYRLVANNDAAGTATLGPDTTFTTPAATPSDAGTGAGGGDGAGGGGSAGQPVTPANPGVILGITPTPISPSDPGASLVLKPTLHLDGSGRATARRLLRGKVVKLRLRCGGPACRARVRGELRRAGAGRLGRLAVPPKALRIAKGGRGTASVLVGRRLRRTVNRRLRAGRRVVLRLSARFTDADGTEVTRTLRIRVPRPRA